jgi:plastocyanin
MSDNSPGWSKLGRPDIQLRRITWNQPLRSRGPEPTGLGLATPATEMIMKRAYLFPLACVLSLAGLLVCFADEKNGDKQSEAKPITVTMKSLSYDPKKLEVHVGDSVVWTNEARTTHTATSDDEGKTFDTGAVEPGKSSKPVKLEEEGELKYHCKIHGKTMSGTIVVKPAGSGTTR